TKSPTTANHVFQQHLDAARLEFGHDCQKIFVVRLHKFTPKCAYPTHWCLLSSPRKSGDAPRSVTAIGPCAQPKTASRRKHKMKNAVIIISDPKAGTDEALGRLLNGLVLARESAENGDQVAIVFTGPGTRWPAEITKPGHPANALYNSVRPHVLGASC